MATFNEIKAGTLYSINRNLFENFRRPLRLKKKEDATLESARAKNRLEGDFEGAANDYYSVYLTSESSQENLESLFGLTQELINLGKFRQARRWLGIPVDKLRNKLRSDDRHYLIAKTWEQRGWIDDLELGFAASIEDFTNSKMSLTERGSWSDREKILYSTDTHFLGRGYFGLAGFGIDREQNLTAARMSFGEALAIDQQMVDEGKVDVDKVAFGYSWIARCHLRAGDLVRAEGVLERSTDLFRQHVEATGREGVMANPHLLMAELELARGKPSKAREELDEVIRLRTKVEPYPKGLADAYLSKAYAYRAEGDWPRALGYLTRSFIANPYLSYRGMMGG